MKKINKNITKILLKLKKWNNNIKCQKIFSKISEFTEIEGWLSKQEAYGLFFFANKLKKNAVIVEIGSWKGRSTYCLAKGLKKGKIYAIDPFNADGEQGSKEKYEEAKGSLPLIDQFKETMIRYELLNKIEVLKGYSNQFINNFQQIDFLFIDGDHSIKGCESDYLNYSPKIKKGGYIAFHDYDLKRKELGPTWVINNWIKINPNYKFIKQLDSLWIAQKIKTI
jgi:predicted O-methyltransferase YrrM